MTAPTLWVWHGAAMVEATSADVAAWLATHDLPREVLLGALGRQGLLVLEQPEAEREREDATAMDRQAERDPIRGGGPETVWADDEATACGSCENPFGCDRGQCIFDLRRAP